MILRSEIFDFSLNFTHFAAIVTLEHFFLIQGSLELALGVRELNLEVFTLVDLLKQALDLALECLHGLGRVEGLLGYERLARATHLLKSSLKLTEASIAETQCLIQFINFVFEFDVLCFIDEK